MQGYTGHILKRGLHFASNCLKHKQGMQPAIVVVDAEQNPMEFIAKRFTSTWAVLTFAITFLSYVIFSFAVEYTIGDVVTNLAIVEDTHGGNTGYSSNEPDAPLSKKGLLEDFDGKEFELPAGEALPAQPITRKIRTTIQHLHSVGGFRARFRGLRHAAFYFVVFGILSSLFQLMLMPLGPIGMWLGVTLASIACCNVHATWTHAIISEPSDKGFFQRFLPRSVASGLILPVLRYHISMAVFQCLFIGSTYLVVQVVHNESVPRYLSINLFVLPVLVSLAVALLAVLPAYIALIRAEASLLPEDMNAIVPFDRSFGGRFLQDSSRCAAIYRSLSLRGAWTLFDRNAYKRVAKIQVKFFMISLAMVMAFGAIFAAEVYVVAGGKENLITLIAFIRQQEGL